MEPVVKVGGCSYCNGGAPAAKTESESADADACCADTGAVAHAAGGEGSAAEVVPLLEKAAAESPQNEVFARALGLSHFRRKDCPGAFEAVAPFEQKTSDPNTLNALALFETCLGRRQDAILLLEKSLSIKPDQPGAIQSLNILKGGPVPKG